MIVPMRHMTLLCVAAERETTLERLRELGAVHLELGDATDSDACRDARDQLATARRAQQILKDALAGKPVIPTLSGPHRAYNRDEGPTDPLTVPLPKITGDAGERIAAICQLDELRQELANEAEWIKREIARVTPFGDFDITPARTTRRARTGPPVQSTDFRCADAGRRCYDPNAQRQYPHCLGRDDRTGCPARRLYT